MAKGFIPFETKKINKKPVSRLILETVLNCFCF